MLEKYRRTKFYLGWKKLLNDLKPMTAKQRIEHLWMYYKEWLVIVFFAILIIGLVCSVIAERNKDVLVSGMMINIAIDQEGMNYLTTDYAAYLGATSENQLADMDYTSFGDPMDPEHGESSYNASMILPSRVSGAMLDYMILDKYAMKYYVAYEVYMDLRDVFTEQELAMLAQQDKVIYAQQDGEEERWPIAINITDIPFVQDNVNSEGDVYFALSGSSPRPEMCRNVWEYLHAWKQ